MFDIMSVDYRKAEADLKVTHPATGEPIVDEATGKAFTIRLRSLDHTEVVEKRNARIDKRLQGAGIRPNAASLQSQAIETLVDCTVSWNLIWNREEPECTPDTARKLYTEQAWVREQVDAFVGNRGNFSSR